MREPPKKKVAPSLIDKKGFMILYFVPHCSIALHLSFFENHPVPLYP